MRWLGGMGFVWWMGIVWGMRSVGEGCVGGSRMGVGMMRIVRMIGFVPRWGGCVGFGRLGAGGMRSARQGLSVWGGSAWGRLGVRGMGSVRGGGVWFRRGGAGGWVSAWWMGIVGRGRCVRGGGVRWGSRWFRVRVGAGRGGFVW